MCSDVTADDRKLESDERLKGTKHTLKSWDKRFSKYKWEHWGLRGQNDQKRTEKNAVGWGGGGPNTRQLCSKNRTESELWNSTADIRVRPTLPPLFAIPPVPSILRHSRPVEAPAFPKQLGQISPGARSVLP